MDKVVTKQDEIRKVVAERILGIIIATQGKRGASLSEYEHMKLSAASIGSADNILGYLTSQGVMIRGEEHPIYLGNYKWEPLV